ncbi:hypothetical protein ACA910_016022 [Epithemia clementina (nom. ined.)]
MSGGSSSVVYTVQCYDPLSGGTLQDGSVATNSQQGLGVAPDTTNSKDRVNLLTSEVVPTASPVPVPTMEPVVFSTPTSTIVTGLALWDVETDPFLDYLSTCSQYCFAKLGATKLNVEAITDPQVLATGYKVRPQAPRFFPSRVESSYPYMLFGDNAASGDIYGDDKTWTVGAYIVKSTALHSSNQASSATTEITFALLSLGALDCDT